MAKYKNPFICILLISIFVQCSLCQRSIDPEIKRKIDEFVENVYLPASPIFGLSLGIVHDNGELLYTTGFGLADEQKGIQNVNWTQFEIGSVTKSFTSVLLAKLLHEAFPNLGESVLDTPIVKLFPQFNLTLMDRFRTEHGTVRDLLAHRMCFLREDLQLNADPFNTIEDIVYRTRYNGEACGIRSGFQYNNQMYVAAGELIAILANKSYADALQDFLDDLGLTNTTLVQRDDDFSQMPYRAMPHYVMDGKPHLSNPEVVKRVTLSNAAGGIFSSANDMVRYMRFHLNHGSLDGKQIVPSEVMLWLYQPSNLFPNLAFKELDSDRLQSQYGYGLGLFLDTYDGWQLTQHGGTLNPYETQMSQYPGKKLGIFSSVNMGPLMIPQTVLHAFIFEVLNGNDNALEQANKLRNQLAKEKEKKAEKIKKQVEAIYSKHMKKASEGGAVVDIVGNYGSGTAGNIDVYEKLNEDSDQLELFMDYGRWLKGWLVEEVPDYIYKLVWVTDIVQVDYAMGLPNGTWKAAFDNGTLSIFASLGGIDLVMGTFQLGVSLDTLPVIPWSPDSCGP